MEDILYWKLILTKLFKIFSNVYENQSFIIHHNFIRNYFFNVSCPPCSIQFIYMHFERLYTMKFDSFNFLYSLLVVVIAFNRATMFWCLSVTLNMIFIFSCTYFSSYESDSCNVLYKLF